MNAITFERNKPSHRFAAVHGKVFVMYDGKRKLTVAAVVLPSGGAYVGYSACHPNDQFIKKVGRAKAVGRAFKALYRGGERFEGVFTSHDAVKLMRHAQTAYWIAEGIAAMARTSRLQLKPILEFDGGKEIQWPLVYSALP